MTRASLVMCAAVVLSGCASQIMESYVGRSIEEPILDYGPPANVMDLEDGRRAYQWRVNQSGAMPMTSPSYATVYSGGGFGTAYGSTTTYIPYSQNCVYTLTAAQQGGRWVVDGFRRPTLGCE